MSLNFKTDNTKIDEANLQEKPFSQSFHMKNWPVILSSLSFALSLMGIWLVLEAIRSIHPPEAVKIACEPDIFKRLEGASLELEKVRSEVVKNNTIKMQKVKR